MKGWGPVKFRLIHQAGLTPSAAIQNPSLLPIRGKIGENLQRELSEITPDRIEKQREFAVFQINLAEMNGARILIYDSSDYPRVVYESSNPVPVLYVKGSVQAWKTMERWRLSVPGASGPPTTISLASFRKPRQIADLQLYLDSPKAPMKLGIARRGMQVDGRFALCHAESTRYFHRKKRALAQPPAISSSGIRQRVPFGSNRLQSTTAYTKQDHCSIFSPAVMIAQSAVNGGAMNAYRFGREQGKPVAAFEPDGLQDTGGNALIKNDKKTDGYSFNLKSNPSEYSEWLQSFSCSI